MANLEKKIQTERGFKALPSIGLSKMTEVKEDLESMSPVCVFIILGLQCVKVEVKKN